MELIRPTISYINVTMMYVCMWNMILSLLTPLIYDVVYILLVRYKNYWVRYICVWVGSIQKSYVNAHDIMFVWRSDEAISLLEHILEVKEGRLGTVHPEVEEERNRLSELLKEAGRPRVRKTNTLEELLFISNAQSTRHQNQKNDQKTSVM